jgi:hypothetical protein
MGCGSSLAPVSFEARALNLLHLLKLAGQFVKLVDNPLVAGFAILPGSSSIRSSISSPVIPTALK